MSSYFVEGEPELGGVAGEVDQHQGEQGDGQAGLRAAAALAPPPGPRTLAPPDQRLPGQASPAQHLVIITISTWYWTPVGSDCPVYSDVEDAKKHPGDHHRHQQLGVLLVHLHDRQPVMHFKIISNEVTLLYKISWEKLTLRTPSGVISMNFGRL